MVEKKVIGQHVFETDGEFASLVMCGDVTGEEMAAILGEQERTGHAGQTNFLLCDVSNLHSLSPDARHAFRNRTRQAGRYFLAVIGASFHQRVLLEFVARASKLLQGHDVTVRFFEDQARARSWLLAMREESSGH